MKRRITAILAILCLLTASASALTAEQAGELLETYYIDEVPDAVLEQTTVEGMLAALGDPYTDYYTAQEYAAFLASMEDTALVGIGIQSYYGADGVTVTQTVADSPAAEAGLRAGDCIIAVDGHDTRGADGADIDSWIHGKAGTKVTLTVLRDGERFSLTLTRREVVFPTVTLDRVEDRVGWITCTSFGSAAFRHFYEIITQYDDQVDEWVVDLRGNGGGDVLAAVFSAGCFGGTGSGAYLRDGAGNYYAYLFQPELVGAMGYYDGELAGFTLAGYLTADSVCVLVDENTASAAELFCAAIRDSGAGLIIGARTYGKGVAQTVFSCASANVGSYFPDGDAMKITTERVFSTQGATFDHVGILPTFLMDAQLADEAAALLTAPVTEDEDLLVLGNLTGGRSWMADAMAIPLSRVQAPENARAVAALLSGLPASAYCEVRRDGILEQVSAAQAAQIAGVTLNRATFTDMEACSQKTAVRALGLCGVVSGAGDGAFRPGETLDRAQLCALLAKALRCPAASASAGFGDVPAGAWYAPYVDALYAMGLIEGAEDGLFHPERSVSHEELFVLLARAAKWLDMDFYELSHREGIYGDQLPDAEELARRFGAYDEWARESVCLCANGLAWARPEEIVPEQAATREEAAAAVYNLLRLSGALPA